MPQKKTPSLKLSHGVFLLEGKPDHDRMIAFLLLHIADDCQIGNTVLLSSTINCFIDRIPNRHIHRQESSYRWN